MKTKHFVLLALLLFFSTALIAQEATSAQPEQQVQETNVTPPPPPPPPPPPHMQPDGDGKAPHRHQPRLENPLTPGWHSAREMRDFFQKLQKDNPNEYNRLMKMRIEDREKFLREVFHAMPRPMRESEQRIEELDKQCWALGKKLQTTSDEAEKAAIKEEISKAAAETLDLLIAQTEQNINEMNERLKSFRENHDKILEKKINFFTNLPKPHRKKP